MPPLVTMASVLVRVEETGQGAGGLLFDHSGRRRLIPGVHRGVEGGGGQVGGCGDGKRRAVQMSHTVGVCGVGRSLGDDAYQRVQRFVGSGAVLREYLRARVPHTCGDRPGTARGQRPSAHGCTLGECTEHDVGQCPQCVRAVDSAGRGLGVKTVKVIDGQRRRHE